MTEYRIVATLDIEHVYNGKRYHYDAASPHFNGFSHNKVYHDRKVAEEVLALTLKEVPKFDKKTQESTDRSAIRYWHSNIRIQSREVTEWSD